MKRVCVIFLIIVIPLFSEVGYVQPWGKDAILASSPPLSLPVQKDGFLAYISLQIINFHRNVLSPVDGPRSHFRPSSSKYMFQAIKTYGVIKGVIMGCDRLLRENREEWVYQVVNDQGKLYKWDPPYSSSKTTSILGDEE